MIDYRASDAITIISDHISNKMHNPDRESVELVRINEPFEHSLHLLHHLESGVKYLWHNSVLLGRTHELTKHCVRVIGHEVRIVIGGVDRHRVEDIVDHACDVSLHPG